MSRLVWGEPGTRLYETGVDRGVFYPQDGVGVPWNGLMAVSEAPSGSDILETHYDGEKFRQRRQRESFAAKVSAYTYPREMGPYDGLADIGHAQQTRKLFNMSYRTKVGSDLDSDFSYLIHIVYNALLSPTSRDFKTAATGVDVTPFEWELTTIPEFLPGGEVSAHVIVDPRMAYPWALATFENMIYGSVDEQPRCPSMIELVQLFEDASILKITDNGDGTWTADGPDDIIQMLGPDLFQISWPSAVYIDDDTYRISSL